MLSDLAVEDWQVNAIPKVRHGALGGRGREWGLGAQVQLPAKALPSPPYPPAL